MKQVIVKLWDTTIGYVFLVDGHNYATFKYDHDFMQKGIEVAPLMMPLSTREYRFSNLDYNVFHGLPGLLSDALPDRFGTGVFNAWLNAIGKEITNVERLMIIANRGMGALNFAPSLYREKETRAPLNIKTLLKTISDVMTNKGKQKFAPSEALQTLMEVSSLAGGRRPKASLLYNRRNDTFRSGQSKALPGEEYYLLKFDGVMLSENNFMTKTIHGQIEYAYYLMAKAAGIKISESQLYEIDGAYFFMTKRFDRIICEDGSIRRLHMQTLGALTHTSYNDSRAFCYEKVAEVLYLLNLGQSAIHELFRRMVFNVIVSNLDDHVKNISFLMNEKGIWSLAPAYDLTFVYDREYPFLNTHEMAINGKVKDIEMRDVLSAARTMKISKDDAREIISEVTRAVKMWHEFARTAFLTRDDAQAIYHCFNHAFLKD